MLFALFVSFVVAPALLLLMVHFVNLTDRSPRGANDTAVAVSVEDQLRADLEAAIHDKAVLVGERDDWKQQAETQAARVRELEAAMRATPATASEGDTNEQSKFHRLRSLIATEFHPDHAAFEGAEKAIRAEIFKALWPKVLDIERR